MLINMCFIELQMKSTWFLAYEKLLARSSAEKSFIVQNPCNSACSANSLVDQHSYGISDKAVIWQLDCIVD